MLTVFKYPVKLEDRFALDIPRGGEILTVDMQAEKPQLWALVNPEAYTEKRYFRVAGTGHPIKFNKEDLKFISTFQMMKGALIFHVFELL